MRLSNDGVPVSQLAAAGAIATSAGVVRIGGNAVWSEWFAGAIDEVRVYARALSPAEIPADMPENRAVEAPRRPRRMARATLDRRVLSTWGDETDNVRVGGGVRVAVASRRVGSWMN